MWNGYGLIGAAALNPFFDCGALFVIVPGRNQQKGHVVVGRMLAPQVEGIGKGLAAARGDMPVEPPRSFAVVETGPGASYGNLVGIF